MIIELTEVYGTTKHRKPLDELDNEYKRLVRKASDRETPHNEVLEIRERLSAIRRAIKFASVIELK